MEALAKTILVEVAVGIALVIVVSKFLAHLKAERESRERIETSRLETLSRISEDCHDRQAQLARRYDKTADSMAEVVRRNSEVIAKNTAVLGRVERTLDKIDTDLRQTTDPE